MTEPDTTTEESDDGRLLTSRRAVIGALASAGVIGATTGAASSDTSAAIGGGPVASEISDLEVRTYSGTFDERPDAGVEGRLYEVYDPGGEEHGAVFYDDGSSWDKVDRRVQNLYSESINTEELLNAHQGHSRPLGKNRSYRRPCRCGRHVGNHVRRHPLRRR